LIGSIVDEVKALRLYEDTTIVFWSDHVGAATFILSVSGLHSSRDASDIIVADRVISWASTA